MSEEVSTSGRASLQTVDARVARLEEAQGRTDQTLAILGAEQKHLRELMTSQFQTVNTAITAQGGKLDAFISEIRSMILEATRNAGDLSASPVGRDVDKRLTALEEKGKLHDSFIDNLRGMSTAMKGAFGVSGLSALIGLATLGKMAGLY